MKKNDISNLALIMIASYIAAQVISDIASLKIASIGLPVVGRLAIDAGTFIYPITFTLRDVLHKILGKKVVQKIIMTSAVINLLMSLFFAFVVALPADKSWGLQTELQAILGPIWQIVFASIVAEVFSELADTEAYSFFVKKITTKFQWGRVLFSNFIAIPIDSILFSFIAFWGKLPVSVIWSIVVSNIMVKLFVTVISVPGIYLSKDTDHLD